MIPIIIVSMTLGGYLGWVTGHGSRVIPKQIYRALKALPYGLAVYSTSPWYIALGVFAVTMAAVSTGHGDYQDLGEYSSERYSEKFNFILRPLADFLPPYWYDALGLSVTGLLVTLPAGIVLLNPVIALSGALKGPSYMLGKLMAGWVKPTVAGEIMTFSIFFGILAAVMLK